MQKEVVVELARPGAPKPLDTTVAENISEGGMRVVSKHVWRPGDVALLVSPTADLLTQARVVYCERLENKGFAVGLQLSTRIKEVAKADLAKPH
jgi:hypothetical protein